MEGGAEGHGRDAWQPQGGADRSNTQIPRSLLGLSGRAGGSRKQGRAEKFKKALC